MQYECGFRLAETIMRTHEEQSAYLLLDSVRSCTRKLSWALGMGSLWHSGKQRREGRRGKEH